MKHKFLENKDPTEILIWSAVILSLALFFLRFFLNTSFTQPLHITTSGYEEESLYALWKYLYRPQEVYSDFHNMPFAASYFNWLFYSAYGEFTKICIAIFGLSDEWIPQIGRIFTLLGCLVGIIFSKQILQLLCPKIGRTSLAIAAYIFFSPLVGFWGITVRPDLWAVVFEVMGLYYFLRLEKNFPLLGAVIFALFCYISWSFKQSHIGLLLGICLYLFFSKRVAELCIIILANAIMYAITIYLFRGTDYLYMILTSQAKMPMILWLSVKIYLSAIIKSPLTLLATTMLLIYALINRKINFSSIDRFKKVKPFLFIFISYLIITIVLSMKSGASDNYFIGYSIFSTFLLVLLIEYLGWKDRFVIYTITICSLIAILGITLVLFGFQGRINLNDLNIQNIQIKQCVKHLKMPIYVNSGYGSLPWINLGSPSFVLAATYFYKDKYGDNFENNGIEGLINQKYFHSILIPNGNQQLDENLLKLDKNGYTLNKVDGCQDVKVFSKND
jgi:hypothetical protein